MGKKLLYALVIILCMMSFSCVAKSNDVDWIDDACYEIEINNSIYCTGFMINASGNILTSAHSFANSYESDDISIYAKIGKQTYSIALISIDFEKDIALLQCDLRDTAFICLDSEKQGKCKYAYVFGNTYGEGITKTKLDVIDANINICTDTKSYLGAIFEGDIALGCSGAPIIGDNGNFLGMLVGKSEKNNEIFAVSADEINSFLENI